MCIVTLPPPSPLLLPPPPPPSPPILPEKGRVLATYSWMWDTFCRTFCARIKVFSLARSLSFRENFRIQICTYLSSCHILPVTSPSLSSSCSSATPLGDSNCQKYHNSNPGLEHYTFLHISLASLSLDTLDMFSQHIIVIPVWFVSQILRPHHATELTNWQKLWPVNNGVHTQVCFHPLPPLPPSGKKTFNWQFILYEVFRSQSRPNLSGFSISRDVSSDT